MTAAHILFVAVTAVGLLMCLAAMRRNKLLAVPLYGALVVAAEMMIPQVQGTPRAAEELPEDAQVVGFQLSEGEGIWLYIQPQDGEPESLRLPWSLEMAVQLQAAAREAEANGTRVMTRRADTSSTEDRDPEMIYAEPQAPSLPKE